MAENTHGQGPQQFFDGSQPGQQNPGGPGQQAAQPRREKYNTVFLTGNLVKKRRRNQLIVVGSIGAVVLGAVLWSVILRPAEEPHKAGAPAHHEAPVAAEAHK